MKTATKKLLILLLWLNFLGCKDPVHQEAEQKVNSITYPLRIDDAEKLTYKPVRMIPGKGSKVYPDTIVPSRGELYRQDSTIHPLQPFYLSYSEWKTIRCIIAIDEHDYWDKSMIGLLEKSGRLRINYKGQTIRLAPLKVTEIKKGQWINTFKNDSMEIQISAHLKDKRILRYLAGNGNLVLKYNDQVFEETVYCVYEIK